ncbi:MAG TPA: dihydrolipoamide acetyltransferase family protein [Polyangiaceae bacterium]|nr:dihydrolipoamide acetyltransferase family protein [Polyangiaceae bacterium]
MAKLLEMPKLSPTMEEGVLTAWHKNEGDEVAVDDLLAEVETDKATMEFRAFDKGTLLKRLVADGATVKLGQPVAILGAPGEDVSPLVAKAGGGPAAQAPAPPKAAAEPSPLSTTMPTPAAAPSPITEAPEAQRVPPRAPRPGGVLDRTAYAPEPVAPSDGGTGRVLASPYVRKVARERGLDLRGAQGSGPGGRLVAQDLDRLKAAASPEATAMVRAPISTLQPPGPALGEPEARPLSMMRKTIARRLTEAKQKVPHFYLHVDVDPKPLLELRERINQELAESTGDGGEARASTKVSVTDLLIKACALALVRVPECNASYTDEAILVHKRVDVSVAVAVPDGLVTPVVRNADQKTVAAIAREVRDLAARARTKKLRPEEMQNGTFSISNLGMFGIDDFAAVINPPEGAILAVGQVRDEPVVEGGAVVPGKRLGLTMSCDHRVVDGAVGAAFLAELRALLARPMRLLTG